jgi:hypothetical protein
LSERDNFIKLIIAVGKRNWWLVAGFLDKRISGGWCDKNQK